MQPIIVESDISQQSERDLESIINNKVVSPSSSNLAEETSDVSASDQETFTGPTIDINTISISTDSDNSNAILDSGSNSLDNVKTKGSNVAENTIAKPPWNPRTLESIEIGKYYTNFVYKNKNTVVGTCKLCPNIRTISFLSGINSNLKKHLQKVINFSIE